MNQGSCDCGKNVLRGCRIGHIEKLHLNAIAAKRKLKTHEINNKKNQPKQNKTKK